MPPSPYTWTSTKKIQVSRWFKPAKTDKFAMARSNQNTDYPLIRPYTSTWKLRNHLWKSHGEVAQTSPAPKHRCQQTKSCRGHYITNPNNALLQGKFLKTTIYLHCLIPERWVPFNDPWAVTQPCSKRQGTLRRFWNAWLWFRLALTGKGLNTVLDIHRVPSTHPDPSTYILRIKYIYISYVCYCACIILNWM